MDFHRFLAELKRRRVLRVGAAYAVVAWVVVQVASVFVPALGLPEAFVTGVAALAILGFPLALVLAWAFEVRPEAPSPAVADVAPRRAGGAAHARWAAPAVLALAVATVGGVALARQARDVALDPDAVLILPFRVAGDPSHAYLREGMVDLLSPRFTGVGGPAAVDSRTALRVWREAAGEPGQDVTAEQATALARQVGAGQVLLGEVVVTPGSVSLQASVYGTADGVVRVRTEPQRGDPDSLVVLVERLAAELLGREAGVDRERLPLLASFSAEAVRSYLAGQVAYRNAKWREAAEHFGAAVRVDSTFALASIGLYLARAWAGYGGDYALGRRLAWQYRDRLPPRDQQFLAASLGERWPRPTPPRLEVAAWERYVDTYREHPEGWYHLGDVLFHNGGIAGYADALERSRAAFERALTIDRGFAPARAHLLELHALRRDTASLRREAGLYFAADPEQRLTHRGWLVATMLEDSTWLARARAAMTEWPLQDLVQMRAYGLLYGHPEDGNRALELAARLTGSPTSAGWNQVLAGWHAINQGHPTRGRRLIEEGVRVSNEPRLRRFLVASMFYPDVDTTGLGAIAAALPQEPAPGLSPANRADHFCFLANVQLLREQDPEPDLKRMRAAMAEDTARELEACLLFAQARQAAARGGHELRRAVAQLDSLLEHEYVLGGLREAAGYWSVLLNQQLGQHEAALRAILRRDHYEVYMLAPALLERARLRARLGDPEGAKQDYVSFLAMRPRPEPGAPSELNAAAQQELALLVQEPGRR